MDKLGAVKANGKSLISGNLLVPAAKARLVGVPIGSAELYEFQRGLEKKLRESKRLVKAINRQVHVSVVVPVYGERGRVKDPKTTFVHNKIQQIESVLETNPNLSWDLALVDDGCPEKTGDFCNHLLKREFPNYYISRKVKVLFLKDGVEGRGSGLVKGLRSTRKSRKGGAVLFGLMCELRELNLRDREHILVYTDADDSVHLGQLGLVLYPLVNGPYDLAVGSRRDVDSVVVRSDSRNHRGKLFIFLWKMMIKHLKGIYDTQAPFKAFRGEVLEDILQQVREYGFTFDVELLLRAELGGFRLTKVPIAFYDNTVGSSTKGNGVHLKMLKSIAVLSEAVEKEGGNRYAEFVKSLRPDRWEKIIEGSRDVLSLYDVPELEDEIVEQRVFEVLRSF